MRLPLRFMVPLALLLVTLVLSVWSLQINGKRAVRQVENQQVEQLKQMLAQIQNLLEYALNRGDLEWVKSAVSSLGGYQRDTLALLVDEQGMVVGSTHRTLLNTPLSEAVTQLAALPDADPVTLVASVQASLAGQTRLGSNRDTLLGIYPIFFGPTHNGLRPTRVGALLLQHDLHLAKYEALHGVKRQVLQFVLVLSLMVLLLGGFFQVYVSKRIHRLVEMAERIAAGDLSARSGVGGRDELAELATAFDQMAMLRADAEAALEAARANLERLVAERTASLEAANQQLQQEIRERTQIEAVLDEQVRARSKAINALRDSEDRLRRSQLFAHIGTWDWNTQSGDIFWSETIAPLLSGPHSQLSSNYENFLNSIHPDDRLAVTQAVQACLDGQAEYDIEHRVVWPDGSVHWLHERGNVVRANGEVGRMLGVVQDITARKQADQVLQEKMAELEQFNRVAVTRELSMIELKKELNALAVKLGEPPRYEIFED